MEIWNTALGNHSGQNPASDPCAIFQGALPRAKLQTLALSALVGMEMLKVGEESSWGLSVWVCALVLGRQRQASDTTTRPRPAPGSVF